MKLFADSGAYSAWANSTSVTLSEYIDFIWQNKDSLEVYACLDDIANPENTWKNQEIMEKEGLHPLPVYHVDEPEYFLDRAMAYDYFAVGGMALKGSVNRKTRFETIFKKICTKENNFYPTHKIHGFGLASPELLINYPWYSVDTTSWVMYGRYGIILVPRSVNGVIHYDVAPEVVTISSRSKSVGKYNSHYKQLGENMQKVIRKYCESKGFPIGRTLYKSVTPDYVLKENEKWTDRKIKDRVEKIVEPGLCCDGEMRDRLNLCYFLDLEKYQKKWPWPWQLHREEIFPNEIEETMI